MITDTDGEQNERLKAVEESCKSLGRSVDLVRDDLREHEAQCKENWRRQNSATGRIEGQLKTILWVLGGIGTAAVAVAVEVLILGWFSGG